MMMVARGEPSRAILATGLTALLGCKPAGEGPTEPGSARETTTPSALAPATGDAAAGLQHLIRVA